MKNLSKFFMVILSILFIYVLFNSNIIYAANKYSDVMDDLRNDESFNVNDYQSDPDDYSLNVITIAEGEDKELFLYVHIPSKKLLNTIASKVLMHNELVTNVNDEFHPILYDLELVSSYGDFDKYVIKDYSISDEPYRYYNIVSIYREFNSSIDEVNVNTDYVAYSVGRQWCCYIFNDEINYEMNTFGTMQIDIIENSFVRFFDGIVIGALNDFNTAGDAHFIAFNCDEYKIKYIYDADLSFKTRDCSYTSLGGTKEGSWSQVKDITLRDTDNDVSFQAKGLFGMTYNWNRISTGEEFVKNMRSQNVRDINGDLEKVSECQWVFAFLETNYSASDSYASYQWSNWTEVGDVGIFRIHFYDFSGKIYNLGVVSNITTSKINASGVGSGIDEDSLFEWLEILILIVGIIALFVILGFCSPLLKILVFIIEYAIKGIVFIFLLPFKLFKNVKTSEINKNLKSKKKKKPK